VARCFGVASPSTIGLGPLLSSRGALERWGDREGLRVFCTSPSVCSSQRVSLSCSAPLCLKPTTPPIVPVTDCCSRSRSSHRCCVGRGSLARRRGAAKKNRDTIMVPIKDSVLLVSYIQGKERPFGVLGMSLCTC
jgi:hypothetical protein